MPQSKVNFERIINISEKMFAEEGNDSDFSTETFMGAILRKQREMPWIFGNVRAKEDTADDGSSTSTKKAKEDTTDDGSSTSTLKDVIENQEKNSGSEESKKDTTKNGSSFSLITRKTKGDTTDDGSSTSTLKDIIENQEDISGSEELKKDTTKNGSSFSLKKKASVGYTYKQRRYNNSESSMKSFFEERMKNFYKTSKHSKKED